MAKQEILLNHVFLKNRITELGIKQWWLAEQVGADRKTVIRWIQGQVRSIQLENAEKLAKILSGDVDQLTVANSADQLATPQDQKQAASLLVNSSLIDKLGPIGEWNVIEGLLKATVVPNLPLNVLGEVYNQLTVVSWRQSKIDQAAEYNSKSEEIALKTGDKELQASVFLSKANIYSWRGQTASAIATYIKCLALEKFIDSAEYEAKVSILFLRLNSAIIEPCLGRLHRIQDTPQPADSRQNSGHTRYHMRFLHVQHAIIAVAYMGFNR